MWNYAQNIGKAAYGYVNPVSWVSGTQQQQHVYYSPTPPPKPLQPKSAPIAVGVTVGTILSKLIPWDTKGYVKRILASPTEEKAVALFTHILDEDNFGTLLSNGRQALGGSDQAVLIKFFAQMAEKYPQHNLYSAVTSIVAQLG
jgi:hypothetical protein